MHHLGNGVARVKTHLKFKLALSFCLAVFFTVPYFTLQYVVLLPVRTLGTAIDDAIAFDPRWVWVYQSVYLLVGMAPWLSADRAELARYARGFVLLSSVGFACFLLFPVAAPRPEVTPTSGMYGWLVWYDRTTNTWPSLHVGLAGFTLFFGARISEGDLRASARLWLLVAGVLWVAAIAYAALATKQHYAVDLPAGLLLAWLAHRWCWRDARTTAPVLGDGTGARMLGEQVR
jgi:membrane-associated phospholipid phosphatase